MFCPKCGTQNPDTGKFCRSCGTDLGNVTAALTGNLPKPQTMYDRRDNDITWEGAITKLFMGLAFLVVSIILAFTQMGRGWWFWMLIPAFALLGTGLAHLVQLKKLEKQNVSFAPPSAQNTIFSAPPNSALPPTQTEYVNPAPKTAYDTGEFAAPPSVTEGTTRHLEINHEGETMTLPKK